MKAELLHFGMVALVPAALNIAAPAAGASILVPVCTGDGQVHMMTVPVGGGFGSRPGHRHVLRQRLPFGFFAQTQWRQFAR
jgi:hypothetical protein